MSFNAISFMNYEISDLEDTYGHDMSPKEKNEYLRYGREIQRLYTNKNIPGLERISNDPDNYPACVQRCADEAISELMFDEIGYFKKAS